MAEAQGLQLRVVLVGVDPPVWRRVVVPAVYPLRQLHFAIQHVLPWTDRHLYEFEIAGRRYAAPDPFDDDSDQLDDADVPLDSVVAVGDRFCYTYDFGDDWRHDIRVEQAAPLGVAASHATCIDGRGAAPPEDVGGPDGYAHFLRAMADPQHPEHDEWRSWLGRNWAAEAFSVEAANKALAMLRGAAHDHDGGA